MRGGISIYAVGKIPPLPSCLAPPECCRSVPFCVPDDPQSHINKGGGSSIRGCYALYLHDARVAHEMRKDPAVFSFYLSFSHFVKLQIPIVYLSFSCGKPAPKTGGKPDTKPDSKPDSQPIENL